MGKKDKAARSPAFQFYPADYLADEKVQLLTLEQEGAYIRAISYCWREGSIPANPDTLAFLIGKGCTSEVARVVQGCFKGGSTTDRLVHSRLEAEREKQAIWRAKSSEGGKLSGAIRAKRAKESILSRSKGGCNLVEPKGNSSSSSAISSKKKKESVPPPVEDPLPPLVEPSAATTPPLLNTDLGSPNPAPRKLVASRHKAPNPHPTLHPSPRAPERLTRKPEELKPYPDEGSTVFLTDHEVVNLLALFSQEEPGPEEFLEKMVNRLRLRAAYPGFNKICDHFLKIKWMYQDLKDKRSPTYAKSAFN